MRAVVLAVLAACLALPALAEEKPALGPVPAWVVPLAVPADHEASQAPMHMLLEDHQLRFEPGRRTEFAAVAVRINTARGLDAGNISFIWAPGQQVLTVHRLLIHRGSQVIDVLKSGQEFVVLRREQNLEGAVLDGTYTANIQPEDLRVGDVLDYAISIATADPVMRGHLEQVSLAAPGLPVQVVHFSAQWPAGMQMRLREMGDLPVLVPVQQGGLQRAEWTLRDARPVVPPNGAPGRYRLGRLVELSNAASWQDIAGLMAPLYRHAAMVPPGGTLAVELARIRAASPDPVRRAEAALALAQDGVRYVDLAMGAGGYVPADAQQTWSRRYGDCKGKTVLVLALLHAMDIEAEPVLVSTTMGDGMDLHLPMLAPFDHVLVRAVIGGRTYWLDGTRSGDTSLDRLTVPDYGWGLPLGAPGAALVRMVPPPLAIPEIDYAVRLDWQGGTGVAAPMTAEAVLRGDTALQAHNSYAAVSDEARDRAERTYWSGRYPGDDIGTVGARFDAQAGEMHLSMTGTSHQVWRDGVLRVDDAAVGEQLDIGRQPGPGQDAPFAVAYPFYTRTRTTILLPPVQGGYRMGEGTEAALTAGAQEYRRHAHLDGTTYVVEASARTLAPEFPAREAAAAQASLRTLYNQPALLIATPQDDAAEIGQHGLDLLQQRRFVEAAQQFDIYLASNPLNAQVTAARAVARTYGGDLAGARRDAARALALAPTLPQALAADAVVASFDHQTDRVIRDQTAILRQVPDFPGARQQRAIGYLQTRQWALAMADAEAGLRGHPADFGLLEVRARIHHAQNDAAGEQQDWQAMLAAKPDCTECHLALGRLYQARLAHREAAAEYGTLAAMDPKALTWLRKADAEAPWDRAAIRQDVEAALKAEPASFEALTAMAKVERDAGNYDRALELSTRLVTMEPEDLDPLVDRAVTYDLAGREAEALADGQRALARDPAFKRAALLCVEIDARAHRPDRMVALGHWLESVARGDPQVLASAASAYAHAQDQPDADRAYAQALAIRPDSQTYLSRSLLRPPQDVAGRAADLAAALRLNPRNADILHARALLQLQQRDVAGAIASDSAALAIVPDSVVLLADRGVAYARAGKMVLAQRDFAAAHAISDTGNARNELCWALASGGQELRAALQDCTQAVAAVPRDGHVLDSMGLVLLRLGQLDESIAVYTKGLTLEPGRPYSLYGRGLAYARKGDRAQAAADRLAAVRVDPAIADRFAEMGLK